MTGVLRKDRETSRENKVIVYGDQSEASTSQGAPKIEHNTRSQEKGMEQVFLRAVRENVSPPTL